MLVKPFSCAACFSSGIPSLVPAPLSITSSPLPLQSSRWPRKSDLGRCGYATVHHSSGSWSSSSNSSSVSEQDWPSKRNPTPYDIFSCEKRSVYTKARYYQLVKIYHPDRHIQVASSRLTAAVRLERYRLIVTANDILSDPIKRRAYDRFGAGWGNDMPAGLYNSFREADRSWRQEPGNASQNATWEDWERWYAEREEARTGEPRPKQKTVFMSNELFVVVICAFAIVGSMGQAQRANKHTVNLVEMRDANDEAISGSMYQRRVAQAGMSRHERVENFIKSREEWNIAVGQAQQNAEREHDAHSK